LPSYGRFWLFATSTFYEMIDQKMKLGFTQSPKGSEMINKSIVKTTFGRESLIIMLISLVALSAFEQC